MGYADIVLGNVAVKTPTYTHKSRPHPRRYCVCKDFLNHLKLCRKDIQQSWTHSDKETGFFPKLGNHNASARKNRVSDPVRPRLFKIVKIEGSNVLGMMFYNRKLASALAELGFYKFCPKLDCQSIQLHSES